MSICRLPRPSLSGKRKPPGPPDIGKTAPVLKTLFAAVAAPVQPRAVARRIAKPVREERKPPAGVKEMAQMGGSMI